MRKDFTSTGFVVKGEKTLLLMHKKLGIWLPPGGHVEEHETPEEALHREIKEEAGLEVEILSKPAFELASETVSALVMPHHMQMELIKHSREQAHHHVDFIFFCRAKGEPNLNPEEHHEMKWFSSKDLDSEEIEEDVRVLGKRAIEYANGKK